MSVSGTQLFGFQVTGDSIYNLLALGEVETDKDDRPLDPPPRIKSVEVVKSCVSTLIFHSVDNSIVTKFEGNFTRELYCF